MSVEQLIRPEILEQSLERVETQAQNPYENSTLVHMLRENMEQGLPLRIAFFDIDSSLTGNHVKALEMRRRLAEQHIALVFVTSRTEEMAMGEAEYRASVANGFTTRPEPRLKVGEGGVREVAFPDEVLDFTGLYDADAVASQTGNRILLRRNADQDGTAGGYMSDEPFEAKRPRLQEESTEQWRDQALPIFRQIIDEIDPQGNIISLELIEDRENYEQGRVDVAPPDRRVQINFKTKPGALKFTGTGATEGGVTSTQLETEAALAMKELFKQKLQEIKEQASEYLSPDERAFLWNIGFTDDSNPGKGRYSLYMHRTYGSPKARAVQEVVTNVAQNLGVDQSQMELIMLGDSFPDLAMATVGGVGSRAIGILASGSRLREAMTNPQVDNFAGEGIEALKNRMTPLRDEATGDEVRGMYRIRTPFSPERLLIVGDHAYGGTDPIDPLFSFLDNINALFATLQ